MKIIRPSLILSGCVFGLLFLSFATANAQSVPPSSYLFVEVRDTAGNPIPEATVTVLDAEAHRVRDVWRSQPLDAKTNKDGVVQTKFLWNQSHHYDVNVSKPGYLPSEHVFFTKYVYGAGTPQVEGIPYDPEDQGNSPPVPVKIVLLGIPVTAAQSRAAAVADQRHQLVLAAKRGDAANLRKLLQAGVNANAADANGLPAIAWAAFAGDPESIQELFKAGADLRNKNSLGHQALLVFLAEGIQRAGFARKPDGTSRWNSEDRREQNEAIVLQLMKAGAGINVRGLARSTVLNNAISLTPNYVSSKIAKTLIAAGAQVNAVDERGQTPLMLAAQNGAYDITKMLLESGAKASMNLKDKWGRTALINALLLPGRPTDIAAALIAAGASVNDANNEGQTALMWAATYDYLDAIRLLLASGAKASINAKDRQGETALLCAMYRPGGTVHTPNQEIVAALLAAGADVNVKDTYGQTPLSIAKKNHDTELVKMLEKAGAYQ